MKNVTTSSTAQIMSGSRRVDFEHPEYCSDSDPTSCTINGEKISGFVNWRDLLIVLVEKWVVTHPKRVAYLSSHGLRQNGGRSFLLDEKPKYDARRVSSGHWVFLNLGIPSLVVRIQNLCLYCNVDLENVIITYKPKSDRKNETVESAPNFELSEKDENEETDPLLKSVLRVLKSDYANGFRFDTTAIRLLSEKTQTVINSRMQSALKEKMFHRADDVYFLPNMIAEDTTRQEIIATADKWMNDCGFFEISELYGLFVDQLNPRCIDDLNSFSEFYCFLATSKIRCVEFYGTKIARINKSVKDLSSEVVSQILTMVRGEFCGTIEEETLRQRFSGISEDLLARILKEHTEQLVKTEINGIVCYQTLDALGLTDDFSETLADVLEEIDNLGLTPSEDILHTALSIRLGVNFKSEYNVPDDKTYRKLIEMYYKSSPARKWRGGVFAEESD